MTIIERVSVGSGGIQANSGLSAVWWEAVSGDGQYATFTSSAPDLTGDPTGNTYAVFVYDSLTNASERIPGAGVASSISADGRYVAFSVLDNGTQDAATDAAIYDRITQTTELISPHASAQEYSESLTISADGRYVLFDSNVSSLTGDLSGYTDLLFVYDRIAHTTTLVPGWTGAIPFISADGRYVGFGDQIYDRLTGTIEDVLVGTDGKATTDPTGDTFILGLSADDRYVVFQSGASNLVNNDTNGYTDIFVYDRVSHTTERVSVASDGTQANGPSTFAAMSADGRYVAFFSSASDLVSDDTNIVSDAFVYDRLTHTTQRISLSSSGTQANGPSGSFGTISISADGQHIVFGSDASNLVPNDTNGNSDIFLASLLRNQPQNDLPAIDAAHSITSGQINERPNVTGSLALDIATGAIAFTDADLNDRPTASVTHQTVTWQDAQGHVFQLTDAHVFAFENAFSIVPEAGNTNSGKIDWGYTVADSTFDFLGIGETITVTSTVEIDDRHGGKVDQDVTVIISGANDLPKAAPDFTTVQKTSTVTRDASHGLLANDHDPDTHAILHISAINGDSTKIGISVAGAYGHLTLNADGSYSYAADKNGSLPGGSATDIFYYTVDDGHGGKATAQLLIDVQSPAAAKIDVHANITPAADAINSLITSDALWTIPGEAKHLYEALGAITNMIKTDISFADLTSQIDALEAAGVNGDFTDAWRTSLHDAEFNALGPDFVKIKNIILDKTIDISLDYLETHSLLSASDRPLAESVAKTMVNLATANLPGQIVDQSVLIAKEIVGLSVDSDTLVNDAFKTGLMDIDYLQSHSAPGTKVLTAIANEITSINKSGQDLVNGSLSLTDPGFKLELISMVLGAKLDQLLGKDAASASEISAAQNYATSLDKAYGFYFFPDPSTGLIDHKYENFATTLADAHHYDLHGWLV